MHLRLLAPVLTTCLALAGTVPIRGQQPVSAAITSVPERAIAVTEEATCAIDTDGDLRCWGGNDYGRLGNATVTPGSTPFAASTPISLPADVLQVVGGSGHFCALLADGDIRCWGNNGFGQVTPGGANGIGTPTGVELPAGRRAVEISAGGSFNCALLDDGRVSCWGASESGQLGLVPKPKGPVVGEAVSMSDGTSATSVATGHSFACALLDDGRVSCWGANGQSQALGTGVTVDEPGAPVLIGGRPALDVAAAASSACAVLDDGSMWCWGSSGAPAAVGLPAGISAAEVTMSTDAATATPTVCVIDTVGGLWCWGENQRFADLALMPGPTLGTHTTVAVVTGPTHTCAVLDDRSMVCWGDNTERQLGFETAHETGDPVTVTDPLGEGIALVGTPLSDVDQVEAGDGMACALADGDVFCFGSNAPGKETHAATPLVMPGGADAVGLAVRESTGCAILDTGALACWGNNTWGRAGQVGGSAPATVGTPSLVPLGTSSAVVQVDIGEQVACARLADGSARCWGRDIYLGNGGLPDFAPVLVSVSVTVADIAVGDDHACMTRSDGQTRCWGDNSVGQLGIDDNGTVPYAPDPEIVPLPASALELVAGDRFTCVRLSIGRVGCAGEGSTGRLGTGTTGDRDAIDGSAYVNPVEIGLFGLSAAGASACGIRTKVILPHRVACWGAGQMGQIGDGSTANALTMTTALALADNVRPTAVSAGGFATCARYDDGTASCWGRAFAGELGNGWTDAIRVSRPGTRVLGSLFQVGDAERFAPDGPGDPGDPDDPGDPGDPGAPSPAFVPIEPARFVDTRATGETVDGDFVDLGAVEAGTSIVLQIAGRGAVPGDAAAVVANLTAITPTATGYSTLYPCGDVPLAANLTYTAGAPAGNNTIVPLDGDGRLCLFSSASAHYALDLSGFAPGNSPVEPIEPRRFLETRPGQDTVDGAGAPGEPVRAGDSVEVEIAGRSGVADDATAVIVNLSVIRPRSDGFATLYPCGARPLAANLNFVEGSNTPNGALVELSAEGTICVFTSAATDVALDVSAYVPGGTSGLVTAPPARFFDTRTSETTFDGREAATAPIAAGSTIEIQLAGRGVVPNDATAAMLNLAVVRPGSNGFATIFPCGERPLSSSINVAGGVSRANNAIVKLSPTGSICVYSTTMADLVIDVSGALVG